MAVMTVAMSAAIGGELTVSPDGLTPQAALEKIRAVRKAGDKAVWTVRVEGFNVLDRSLAFGPEDHDIEFAGGKEATFSGGVKLGGWRNLGGGVWEADAPKTATGEAAFFDQLWVNGRRAPCARLPKKGYLRVTSATQAANAADAAKRFTDRVVITNDAMRALVGLPEDALKYVQAGVIVKWSYALRSAPAVTVGTDGRFDVTFQSNDKWAEWKRWTSDNCLVAFFNVPAAFTEPGDWFLDMKAGKVRYRLLPGEDVTALEIVAPRADLSRLVDVRGDFAKGNCANRISFRNVRFAYTSAPRTGNGPQDIAQLQAASTSDGALTFEGARNFRFENCEVKHTSNYAMRFNGGCVSNAIVSCTLTDLGAGGIWMGDANTNVAKLGVKRRVLRPVWPSATAFNLISNCTITCGGRYNPEGTGVALTHCSDTKVVHNDIHDFFYTGVSVGWVWGFTGSVAQRNEIGWNFIYDLGKSIMSDMGGVYTLGTSYGTRVHHNVIHDVWSYSYGGWALYTDEGSEGLFMENNVCWNTTDGGFHQHYGTGCVIRNNVFAFNKELGAVRMARAVVQDIPCTLHFVNNIVYVDHGPLVGRGVRNVGGVWANNIWYDARGVGAAELDGDKWDAWVKSDKERGSVFADPKFVNAKAFDFSLRSDSPALKLGFRPIDLKGVGVN